MDRYDLQCLADLHVATCRIEAEPTMLFGQPLYVDIFPPTIVP
jgi:hypothetical protein